MLKGLRRILLFACCVLAFGAFTSKRVQAVQTGLVTTDGKTYLYINGVMVKDKMYTITQKNGKKDTYYFTKTGAACTTSVKYQGNIFCFDKKGRMHKQKGNKVKVYKCGKYSYSPTANGTCRRNTFVYAKNKLYYARSTGQMVSNNTVYGVTFGGNCVAQAGISTTCKIKCIQVLNEITKPNWTDERKLRACWDYVCNPQNFTYVLRYDPDLASDTWMKKKCVEMLESHGGDCVSYACAFAGLAAAIGYKPVVIYGRVPGTRDQAPDGFTTHCWVTINYRFFDPEGQYDGWNKNCYNLEKYPFAYQVTHSYGFESGRIIQ